MKVEVKVLECKKCCTKKSVLIEIKHELDKTTLINNACTNCGHVTSLKNISTKL